MYKIKQFPEDFVVREISDIKCGNSGQYAYFLLKKKNYTTLKAIEKIAEKLKISQKIIGFAGNKDRNAITEQAISIRNGKKNFEALNLKGIELKYIGKGSEEIYIGRLKGNEFTIATRNLTGRDIKNAEEKAKAGIFMPNYFGEQRFSQNNAAIGKAIVKNDFKEAINLILGSNSDFNEKIKAHLQNRKNDFVVALKIIPIKLLKLYIHSYQSLLFNKALEQYIFLIKDKKMKSENIKLPLIGFATEFRNKNIEKIASKIMKDEKIIPRDFIIRAIPALSSEGAERDASIKVDDFRIVSAEKDELNENKEKLTIKFSLPKGCYATILIDFLFSKQYIGYW